MTPKIGLANNSIGWFTSYLDRKQLVRYTEIVSEACAFKNGILHGNCLGPTLFIFYVNDLFKYLENVKALRIGVK